MIYLIWKIRKNLKKLENVNLAKLIYAGTGLCGPCATGESETLEERGDSW